MIYFKLLLMAAFWGGTFVATRMATAEVTPFTGAFLRFSFASLTLIIFAMTIYRLTPLRKQDAIWMVCLGLTGIFLYNVFFFRGLTTVEAGRGGLIIALNPVATFIVAGLIFKETMRPIQILGVLTSFIGALLVLTRGDLLSIVTTGLGQGELYMLGAVGSWVLYTMLGKKVMRRYTPFDTTFYSVLFGTLCLSVPASMDGLVQIVPQVSGVVWFCLFYLGFFGTCLGFVWFYQGVKSIGAGKAAAFVNFVPVFAVLFGMLFLNEQISIDIITGGLLVLTGVLFTNTKRFSRTER